MEASHAFIFLSFVVGGGFVTMMFWSTIQGYAGTYVSKLKKWIAGVTGGTGASVIGIYTQYVDGILIPAYDFASSLFMLNFDAVTLWGFYCFVGIFGTQLLPTVVIIVNYINVGKLVDEPLPMRG